MKTPRLSKKDSRPRKHTHWSALAPKGPNVLQPISFPANTFGKRHLVDFQFYAPGAQSVKVVIGLSGSLARHFELHDLGGGAWTLRLLLSAGNYEYHFLVDEMWQPDPLARGAFWEVGEEKTRLVLK